MQFPEMKSTMMILIIAASALLAGCACKKCDSEFNSISFSFSGFTPLETDTVIIYKLVPHSQNIVDSVLNLNSKPIILNESGFTFNSIGPYWFNDYKIKTQGGKDFLITDLEIESSETRNRCECPANSIKKGKVNGQAFNLSGKSFAESNIVLLK
jgi:hypothetical protein